MILTACAVLLAACGGNGVEAEPTSTVPLPTPAIGATSTPGEPSTPRAPKAPHTPHAPVVATLGPSGYGTLRLGMTVAQARTTRTLVGKIRRTATGCAGYDLRTHPTPANAAGVYLSPRLGVTTIFAQPGMRTPQNIGIGATPAQVKRAYPRLRAGANAAVADVPGDPRATYTFAFTADRVTGISLDLTGQNCHR